MGILDFDTAAKTNTAAASGTNNRRTQAQDRPSAKLWLNVGYDTNGRFVNLPVGIPVDTDGQKLHRVNGDADGQVDEATIGVVAEVQPQLGSRAILCLRATIGRARGSGVVGFGGGIEIENTHEMAPSLGFG